MEFALLLPLLLLLVFGIIDFGRALNAQITITQAAREGARLSALGRPSGEVTARVQDAASPLTVSASNSPCPAAPGPNDRATVTASYPFRFVTPIGAIAGMFGGGGGFGDFGMTGRGVMRCAG